MAGIAIGVPAALALSRLVSAQLFGVSGADPATLGGMTALLGVVAFVACWFPARRVQRIDPAMALRAE